MSVIYVSIIQFIPNILKLKSPLGAAIFYLYKYYKINKNLEWFVENMKKILQKQLKEILEVGLLIKQ